jgi:hypothetical protein
MEGLSRRVIRPPTLTGYQHGDTHSSKNKGEEFVVHQFQTHGGVVPSKFGDEKLA